MKVSVHSDLHLEFQDWVPPKFQIDAVVLAEDIGVGCDGLRWARASFPSQEIIFIP